MPATTPNAKKDKAGIPDKNDANSLIPLLLATLGNPHVSFKTMVALDPHSRTESALEHRFRPWRKEAVALAAAHPDLITPATNSPVKPRAPANKVANAKGNSKQASVAAGDAMVEDNAEDSKIKKEMDDLVDAEMSLSPLKGTNGARKRATSQNAEATEEDNDTPAKKVKVTKKGTATVVKKKAAKARESLESVSDEEDEAETPKVKARPARKPAGKGRGKAAAVIETEEKPIKKWHAEAIIEQAKISHPEETEKDGEVDGEADGEFEMQFDL